MPQKAFTVFIVDDDASIRGALKRLLRSVGYHAETFESAEEFLDSISRWTEGCLVLDIRLPGMTGLDLQERLSLTGKHYPVIFMTAHDNPEYQERANKTGAIAYLKKPFRNRHCSTQFRSPASKVLHPEKDNRVVANRRSWHAQKTSPYHRTHFGLNGDICPSAS